MHKVLQLVRTVAPLPDQLGRRVGQNNGEHMVLKAQVDMSSEGREHGTLLADTADKIGLMTGKILRKVLRLSKETEFHAQRGGDLRQAAEEHPLNLAHRAPMGASLHSETAH